jgi:hypothetical protein
MAARPAFSNFASPKTLFQTENVVKRCIGTSISCNSSVAAENPITTAAAAPVGVLRVQVKTGERVNGFPLYKRTDGP